MAGRIPDSFIHDLLARTDIVELIGSRVELKRAGRELRGLSPFTSEKSPSFFVSPVKQMFFDFSSGKNGNAIGFLMEFDRLSFVEAVEELARRAGVEVPHEGGHQPHVVMDGPLDALAAAQRFFSEQLRKHSEAVAYLKKRGVTGETAKRFGIGFAPESWNALTDFLKETRHAIDAGLLIEKEGGGRPYDRFRNRVMFPIRDGRGRVIGFGGRTLGNDPAKYLNSPETPLFHKGRNLYGLYEARQATTSALPYLIVVEGYMDVVMLSQHGITEAVATLGTATTREHLQLLFKQTSKVVFCFDGDRAGRAAAWRALDQVLPELFEGRECVFMFLPDGHDPDTLVQEIGADAFRARIEQASPLSEFLLGELSRQVNLGSLEGRARLVALCKPYLEKLREGTLRTLMSDQLARLARLERADIEASLAGRTPQAEPAVAKPASTQKVSRLVRRSLEILLHRPDLAEQVGDVHLLEQSEVAGVSLLVETIDYLHSHPDATAATLIQQLGGAKGAYLQKLLMSDTEHPDYGMPLSERVGDEGLVQEFGSLALQLRERGIDQRINYFMNHAQDLSETEIREWKMLVQSRKRIDRDV
ncbi:DNA primase [Sinimarinibacterium sp. CAU 1509]|uniref:DNA primase n=1 Tax=Sinimarinibacterium sp. CAU 1509 TaxID=2562283 RepID=UPI0010AD7715|nr:DNA primase [Sinimarinibacterium sp. CAU 1509]TJY59883.1 DNA primase [Sinimarinibacterium sp. CAU 1509]